jgi:hypothetical protein
VQTLNVYCVTSTRKKASQGGLGGLVEILTSFAQKVLEERRRSVLHCLLTSQPACLSNRRL